MNARIDMNLYRESLGKYLFDGRPEVYFNARLTLIERALLEIHEHDHWARANASSYGREQLDIAEAQRTATQPMIRDELDRCLKLAAQYSRLVYEGAALAAETTAILAGEEEPTRQWYSILEAEEYKAADRLFKPLLDLMPYSRGLTGSIGANIAELCLNSVSLIDNTRPGRSIEVLGPAELSSNQLEDKLEQRSPNSLLVDLVEALCGEVDEFVRKLDDMAGEILRGVGLSTDALRTSTSLGHDALIEGRLIYAVYETLRQFAERTETITDTVEFGTLETLVELRRVEWLRKQLPRGMADQISWRGISLEAPSAEEVQGRLDFFSRVHTVVAPPERVRSNDLIIDSWRPLHNAFHIMDPERRKLYVGIRLLPADEGDEWAARRVELSSARAVLAPQGEFAWKFGQSRYQYVVPLPELANALAEIDPYNPAIAAPLNLFDVESGTLAGVGPLPENFTLGILMHKVPFESWREEIERMAVHHQMASHFYEVGPMPVPFMVSFSLKETADWFTYMPVSLSLQAIIEDEEDRLLGIPNHIAAGTIDAVPMTRRFRLASVLICEQYSSNGL